MACSHPSPWHALRLHACHHCCWARLLQHRERLQRAYDGFHSADVAGLAHMTEYVDLDGPNIPVPGESQQTCCGGCSHTACSHSAQDNAVCASMHATHDGLFVNLQHCLLARLELPTLSATTWAQDAVHSAVLPAALQTPVHNAPCFMLLQVAISP